MVDDDVEVKSKHELEEFELELVSALSHSTTSVCEEYKDQLVLLIGASYCIKTSSCYFVVENAVRWITSENGRI